MVTLHTKRLNERGVSEAIGFMLIFAMVIAGIGLVTLYGYPLLLQQQLGADIKIMEKNMIVLQNDMKSLAYKTVPFKETSLKIGGGPLTVFNSSYTPASSRISIYDQSGTINVSSFTPGELLYESVSGQTDISLQNGAVVERPRINPGSVMISEPRWFYDANTNTMVINLINITSTGIMAKEGIGTVQMTLGETSYTPPAIVSSPLTFVYTPGIQDYSVAWDNYLMKTLNNPPAMSVNRIGTPGTGLPLTYTISLSGSTPMKVVIKKYEVHINNI